MQLRQGARIAGDRYVVERLIGAGGMATVYRIRHLQLDTQLALKVVSAPSEAIRTRLLREGRAQGNLRHPNTVPVVDVVEVEGMPALVMEYVHGPSLDKVLREHRLAVSQADDLARQILAGMGHAHDLGMVHRDLKPGNILLSITNRGVQPRVTDFGLVKRLDGPDAAGATRTGVAMGTPAYMPPEQIRNAASVDARADVFSLGAILYELVCGVRAFDGSDHFAVQESIVYGRFVPLRERVPDVPERMADAIAAALQADPEARPDTAEALLEAWVGGTSRPDPDSIWSAELRSRMLALVEEPTENGASTYAMSQQETLPEVASEATWSVDEATAGDLPAPSPGPVPSRAVVPLVGALAAVLTLTALAALMWAPGPAPPRGPDLDALDDGQLAALLQQPDLDPNMVQEVQVRRATIALEDGRLSEARILAANADRVDARLLLAQIHLLQRDNEQAERVLRSFGEGRDAHARRARSYLSLLNSTDAAERRLADLHVLWDLDQHQEACEQAMSRADGLPGGAEATQALRWVGRCAEVDAQAAELLMREAFPTIEPVGAAVRIASAVVAGDSVTALRSIPTLRLDHSVAADFGDVLAGVSPRGFMSDELQVALRRAADLTEDPR